MSGKRNNKHILAVLAFCALAMLGVAYASVPLYRLFCSATGYGGTTQRAEAPPQKTRDRIVTVSFDSNVDNSLPWDFKPDVREVQVKLGETYIAKFHAHNRSDRTTTGMATFNVQPDKAGSYFSKTQCFCFEKQTLKPGETAEMQVEFYVDPAMADDKNTDDVQNIKLSYTFFRAKEPNQDKVAQPKTVRNPT